MTASCEVKIYPQYKIQKSAVVVGGAGFIGSHLVDRLIKDGFEVRVIDNLSSGKRENVNPRAELLIFDIRNATPQLFEGFEYVFHLAALPKVPYSIQNPEETNDVNVNGTLRLLKAAKEAGVRKFIYSASSSAYGDNPKLPLKETYKPNPKSPYALQKLVGEYYCKIFNDIYKLPTVSLRYFNVYGSRVDPTNPYSGVITIFKQKIRDRKPLMIYGNGTQSRDFTYVDDVVEANIRAMEAETNGEVINIGAGQAHTLLEVAEMLGNELPIDFGEARQGDVKHTLADISLAKKILGWQPKIRLKEGLKMF